MKNFRTIQLPTLALAAIFVAPSVWADTYQPFVLAETTADSVAAASDKAKSSLVGQGFEVVGEYAPNDATHILVVTNATLKSLAANSENGGFGAIERVAVVNRAGKVEVSYTNPTYQFNAYRMKGDISGVQTAMEKALGNVSTYGADEGLSAEDLREYHYKMMMPYFDDEDRLASYGSYEEALKTVEAGLQAKKSGVAKVYRVDIPGKNMSVIGVSLSQKEGSDANILAQIDQNGHSHAAHLPYEILVVEDRAIALNGKFRIAINWPSLSMMGSGSFMSIANAPDHIKEALETVAEK
ncbi:hypothetical protein [Thiosulfativibrio zosterae]|uniref:DUF302 domain-containing protein n=1 Tax=Thiosulfativibrio zosterae TaxID=2675053 RepID=A0A6F8PLU3_9GAMM|nr:hypothetical protein [Thiosulfativibrio zosterae]BBP43056.1 hypothetical protein THMIRHAT_08020 [Thiosulfativibrio zosterae]